MDKKDRAKALNEQRHFKSKNRPEKTKPKKKVQEIIIPDQPVCEEIRNDSDTSEECYSEAGNFETLLQEPVSDGSYFKFKSEQSWENDIKSQLQLSKYFTLDLKLLSDGIASIPFNKRHDYDESLFTHVDLQNVKKNSDLNQQKYKKLLEQKYAEKNNFILKENNIEIKAESPVHHLEEQELGSDNIEHKQIEDSRTETVEEIKETIEDDVEDLLNLKISEVSINNQEPELIAEDPLLDTTPIKNLPSNIQPSAVDLEEWLNDILDD